MHWFNDYYASRNNCYLGDEMRYKCIVSYDGTCFHGFQVQPNLRTVQEEIEKVLQIICKKKITIFPSGRTDTGVHAIGQVFHFDTEIDMGEWNMKNAINSRLPRDIYIKEVSKVSLDFHARFSSKRKEYHYIIGLDEYNPLRKNYVYYPPFKNFDIDKMKDASSIFVGEHDFKSFTKNHKIENTVRTIYSINFEKTEDTLIIKFIGNGFLHNMVRILVAMLFMVGIGKLSKDDLKSILDKKNRVYAPKIAPSNGLYLYEVKYE